MRMINNVLYSPFYIFIKGIHDQSDEEIIWLLGLVEHTKMGPPDKLPPGVRYRNPVYIIRGQEWVHIMDNGSYYLWHLTEIRTRLAELGNRYELFYCSVGDIDYSFDFCYYQNGRLIRHYVVPAPTFNPNKLVVEKDMGEPLPGELQALQYREPYNMIMALAHSLGIDLRHQAKAIKTFGMRFTFPTQNKKPFWAWFS